MAQEKIEERCSLADGFFQSALGYKNRNTACFLGEPYFLCLSLGGEENFITQQETRGRK